MSVAPLSTSGGAVPGTSVPASSLVSPGGAQGAQGIQGPTGVSTDPNNLATLGSDGLIAVPASSIWSVRLRSFNAAGNPSFEVSQQPVVGAAALAVGTALTRAIDRYFSTKGTNGAATTQQLAGPIQLPGTNFSISGYYLRVSVTTAVASLAATDSLTLTQSVEGPVLRELITDVHSVSLLVRSSIAGTFGLALRDSANAYSLVSLCTIPTANSWTLIQLPKLPVWTASGTFPITAGSVGYTLVVCLAAGSTYTTPSNGSWVAGNYLGAAGQSNLFATAGNTFDIAFLQHEPGPLCTTLIDKPFAQNYDECLRYFSKTYHYAIAPGTNTATGLLVFRVDPNALSYVTGYVSYQRPMAKVPNMSFWSDAGTANQLSAFGAGTAGTVSGVIGNSDKGFQGVHLSASNTANNSLQGHYTADTGW